MKSQNEMAQALYTIEAYKHQADNLTKQRQMIMLSMEEHMRARLTLSEYEKQNDGQELLVPIGANVFIHAKAMNSEKVLIGIGNDVIIEDTCKEAIVKLDDVIKILEDADKRILMRLTDIENQIAELNDEVEHDIGDQTGKNG